MTIGSENWSQHLHNLHLFLHDVQKSGLTLSLDKCKFAQCEVRFIGHVVGSGHHRPDEQKLDKIVTVTRPNTKKDIRKMLGFFNYFQSYIPHLAELSARFTDMLMKGKPNYVNWTPDDDCAFLQLKTANVASHLEFIVMRLISQLVVIWFSGTLTVKKYRFHLQALSYLELNFYGLPLRRKLMLSYGH
jgi:hypothetical protein